MKVALDLYPKNLGAIRTAKVAEQKNVAKTNQFDINSLRPNNFSRVLTFTGNPAKNFGQVASIAPEYQNIAGKTYHLGGLGNVASEASVAFHDHGQMDIRTFIPYHAENNPEGKIKIYRPTFKDGQRQFWEGIDEGKPYKVPAYTIEAVDLNYQLKEGEDFIIHSPVIAAKPWKTEIQPIERTSISGKIKSIKADLSGTDEIPYTLFKAKGRNFGTPGKPAVYVMHTPEVAKFRTSYNSGATSGAYGNGAYGGGSFDDLIYGNFSKTVTDAMPKMDKDEFGNFNPGNIWLHDRQTFPVLTTMADQSAQGNEYWNGLRAHSSFHNPGRGYQGHYSNPIDFLRITGSEQDLEALKQHPDFDFVKDVAKKIIKAQDDGQFEIDKVLTQDEIKKLNAVFQPMFGDFVDEFGEYNLCKIPVQAVRKNPYNMSAGTVSTTYGREMKNHTTKEIAYGLTSDFASIPTVDIVNGSTPKSLGLDKVGNFGKNNGFTEEIKKGFTPLTPEVVADKTKLFEAKQSNKKWLIDTIAEAFEKQKAGDPDAVAKLFFDNEAFENASTLRDNLKKAQTAFDSAAEGAKEKAFEDLQKAKAAFAKMPSVLGGMSKFEEGDTLFISWGRPDAQKGFPTTLESYLQFIKYDSLPQTTRDKAKFIIGAGTWGHDNPEWLTIQKQMEEIATIDGGRYKDKVCFLNGFFTNRTVATADYAIITSRYEPCGITPLEAFAGGTPVISNKTGGSPDFIKPFVKGQSVEGATGFLTKHAFFVNPEVIGADAKLTGQTLDEARRIALGKENADCIEQAINLLQNNPEDYKTMAKNAITTPIDWHNNLSFNGGKSAMHRYFEDVWQVEQGAGGKFKEIAGHERNLSPLARLKGIFAGNAYTQATQNGAKDVAGTIEGTGIVESAKQGAQEVGQTVATAIKSNKKLYAILGLAIAGIAAVGIAFKASKNKKQAQALQENQAVKMPEPKVEVKAVQTQPTQPIAQPIIQPQAQKVAQASTMQSVSLQNFIKAHSK